VFFGVPPIPAAWYGSRKRQRRGRVADATEGVVIGRYDSAVAITGFLAIAGCAGSRPNEATVHAPTIQEARPQNAELSRVMPEPVAAVQPTAHNTPVNSEAVKVPAGPAPTLHEVVAKAEAFYEKTPNYTCRITRQERIGGSLQPVEKILLHFRAQPRSVYYRWVGEVCAGRECIWVENANDGKIVSKGGKSDFGMAGRRIAVAPDSFLAKSRARYTINQSGQDVLVRKLRDGLQDVERGVRPADALKYVGLEKPADADAPLHHVVETIAPNTPLFPKGGTRDYYFDPDTGRVVVVEARDPAGERQEYYFFEHLFANNTLTATDFDPELMFAKPGQTAAVPAGDPPK
jgi:hypothetical protein